ncbi:RNA polymerase sigma factor [Candidatus Omnitrophota bacterium]
MDDIELISGCISGEKSYWNQFVEQYTRLIYDSIIRTFKKFGARIDSDILEDLHNDVFVLLLKDQYKALKGFEGRNGCSLASYIRTISVRKTIDYWRKQKPTVSIDAGVDGEEGKRTQFLKELAVIDDSGLLEREDAERIINILFAELQDTEREFCAMCFIENREPGELAGLLGITVDNFYVRKQRMLNKLEKIAKEKKLC